MVSRLDDAPVDAPVDSPADQAEGTRQARPRTHFPGFEGLRALAAGSVLVYHVVTNAGTASVPVLHLPGTDVESYRAIAVLDMGVSVFFVISGFLIYRPFVAASVEGRPSLPAYRFWWRRILRIVPAYWLALSVLWALDWVTLGDQPWRYYLFLQIYDPYTALNGIVPAWSLNTEMAFYLFVPIWAFLVSRVIGRGRPSIALHAAGVASLVVLGYLSRAVISGIDRVWAVGGNGEPVLMRQISFSWLPNTIDLFALGMLLAVASVWASRDDGIRARLDRLAGPTALWWAGAVAAWLVFAYWWGEPSLNGGYQGTYWQARQAFFGAVAVCLLVPSVFGDQRRGAIRRGLASRPIVWLGAVSYGLYLWHLDILQQFPAWFDRPMADIPLPLILALTAGLGLAAAAASWHGLERPLQLLRPGGPDLAVVPPELEDSPDDHNSDDHNSGDHNPTSPSEPSEPSEPDPAPAPG